MRLSRGEQFDNKVIQSRIRGYSANEVFETLVEKRERGSQPRQVILKHCRHFKKNNKWHICGRCNEKRMRIKNIFSLYDYAMIVNTEQGIFKRGLNTADGRCQLSFELDNDGMIAWFVLADLWNDTSTCMPVRGSHFRYSIGRKYCTLKIIDANLVLVSNYYGERDNSNRFDLLLFKLDSDNRECILLDMHMDDCHLAPELVVDEMYPRKFLVAKCRKFVRFEVCDDELRETGDLYQKKSMLLCRQLKGDILKGVCIRDDGYELVEYDLSKEEKVKVQSITMPDETWGYAGETHIPRSDLREMYQKYAWFDHYLLIPVNSVSEDRFHIHRLDTQTLRWETRIITLPHYAIPNMFVDTRGNLTVCASTDGDAYGFHEKGKHTLYRIPLKPPDSLEFLTWRKIRRQKMFSSNAVYSQPNLPFNSPFRSLF